MIYFITFILTLIFILIFSYLSPFFNLIDYPNTRKLHKGTVPLVGGIAIYCAIITILPFLNLDYQLLIIILSSSIVLILGAIDDAIELGVILRLISMLIAGFIVLGSGLSIVDIGAYYFFESTQLGIFGILLTIVSVIGLTNAINFIDGIDGLCSSVVLNAFLSLIMYIHFTGNNIDITFIGIIMASITAFLLINIGFVPLKKVFLGDSGSLVLGFILSWTLIYFSHPTVRYIHPVLTIWCVALPIFDLLGVILRRTLRRINPFKSDRRHIHHILIDLGFAPISVFIIITILSIFLSIAGGLIFFNFGSSYAFLSYIVFFLIYIYTSFNLSRMIFLKKNK